jgi:hypothetical protein
MSSGEIKGTLTPEELGNRIDPSPEVRELRNRIRELSSSLDSMKEDKGYLEVLLGDVKDAVERAIPSPMKYDPSISSTTEVSNPCVAVAQLSDIHYGAVQEKSEIENFGEFSPEICAKRLQDFGARFIDWIGLHRHTHTIDEVVIAGTGDFTSGDIHQELQVTNAFPHPVQAVGVGYLFADWVAMIAPHFPKVRVEIITDDNHGRFTRKPQSKQAGLNNMMYVVAHIARSRLELFKNVEFNIHTMPEKVIDVAGMRYLMMHGHKVKGWGGYPWYGTMRKAGKEALARMNLSKDVHFDKMLMGHFHSPLNHQYFMVGGSVSGTDAYDHGAGRHCPPSQTAWLVHPKHGEVDWNRFWL